MTRELVIKNIDFDLLRKQKTQLIELQYRSDSNGNPVVSSKEYEALEGIINLIDHIQDEAIKQLGLSEEEVFNLSKEE
jgi:hypothetical protein